MATGPILFVIETLGIGGAEHALLDSARELARRGHRCHVAVLWAPYDLQPGFKAAGIAVHRLDLNHRWNAAQAVMRLTRLRRRIRPAIVHAHLFFATLYAQLSSTFSPEARLVVTFHNLKYDSYPATTAWERLRKRIDGAVTRRFDSAVAVSHAVARHYATHLDLSEVRVIPNPIDLDTLDSIGAAPQTLRARYAIAPDEFLAVVPARMVFEKGHRYLLEALRILRGRGVRPRVAMIGGGPLFESIRAMVESFKLRDTVIMTGTLARRDALELIAASDVAVIPSIYEGLGIAAGEAMGLGKPILATTAGGLAELVQDDVSGVQVPPADPAALAAGLELLMSDHAMRIRMGKAGRWRIEAAYALSTVADRWEELYAQVLRGSLREPLPNDSAPGMHAALPKRGADGIEFE